MLTATAGALTTLTALAGLVVLLRRHVAVVSVIGHSMQPTLTAGDRVIVRRARIDHLRTGQIVVFENPGHSGTWITPPPRWPATDRELMIKRVAATPGDPVPSATAVVTADVLVPAGNVIVFGDNLANSRDSRQIGYIPAERLLGVVVRPLHARPERRGLAQSPARTIPDEDQAARADQAVDPA